MTIRFDPSQRTDAMEESFCSKTSKSSDFQVQRWTTPVKRLTISLIRPFWTISETGRIPLMSEGSVMSTECVTSRRSDREAGLPSYVHHPDFDKRGALKQFSPDLLNDHSDYETKYMPDDVTREFARRMHYAGHRIHQSSKSSDQRHWQQLYFRLRDRIVLGNRKLIYRAVRRRMAMANRADDLIGECHIVLIQAVAAYNPWMGIRFSTYAFTCLVRALSRLSQRMMTDWLSRSMPLEMLAEVDPSSDTTELVSSGFATLDVFFREDHPLLSAREKLILSMRFRLSDQMTPDSQTLERVGKELGLSKERVRQVQASALDKLRRALGGDEKGCDR